MVPPALWVRSVLPALRDLREQLVLRVPPVRLVRLAPLALRVPPARPVQLAPLALRDLREQLALKARLVRLARLALPGHRAR